MHDIEPDALSKADHNGEKDLYCWKKLGRGPRFLCSLGRLLFFSETVACKVCLFMIMPFLVYMIICNVGKWKVSFLVSLFLLG